MNKTVKICLPLCKDIYMKIHHETLKEFPEDAFISALTKSFKDGDRDLTFSNLSSYLTRIGFDMTFSDAIGSKSYHKYECIIELNPYDVYQSIRK